MPAHFCPPLRTPKRCSTSVGFPPIFRARNSLYYERRVADLARDAEWSRHRRKPGIGTHLLAFLVVIVPNIGPIKMLAIKGPTVETRKWYLDSVNNCTAALALCLGNWRPLVLELCMPHYCLTATWTPGRRWFRKDTPTDQTYAKLLGRITKDPRRPVPDGLKQDILRYTMIQPRRSPPSETESGGRWSRSNSSAYPQSQRERSQIDRSLG